MRGHVSGTRRKHMAALNSNIATYEHVDLHHRSFPMKRKISQIVAAAENLGNVDVSWLRTKTVRLLRGGGVQFCATLIEGSLQKTSARLVQKQPTPKGFLFRNNVRKRLPMESYLLH